jgi:hypothetical protein
MSLVFRLGRAVRAVLVEVRGAVVWCVRRIGMLNNELIEVCVFIV